MPRALSIRAKINLLLDLNQQTLPWIHMLMKKGVCEKVECAHDNLFSDVLTQEDMRGLINVGAQN